MYYLRKHFTRYHWLFFVFSYVVLQVAFSSGASLQRQFNIERGILAVENRISLDLAHLSLPNPELNMAGNASQVLHYLQELNEAIAAQSLPVSIHSLQTVVADTHTSPKQEIVRQLIAPEQTINLSLHVEEPGWLSGLSGYPLLLAGLLLILIRPYLKRKPVPVTEHHTGAIIPLTLTLDLTNKALALGNKQVPLANKPLCFYAALLNYCQQHPEVRLCQHHQLPDALLELADKYFLRLVELGHTIRKRPDFNANLEKMLSEIRAALDELLSEYPDLKPLYYPPKATGEGSRSRMHNFALTHLQPQRWDITGK